DLTVKDDDLVVATHGRSFWVLDDLASLRQMADLKPLTVPYLFVPKDAVRGGGGRGGFGGGGAAGQNVEYGQNPPAGIIVDYWLPTKANDLELQVLDKDGTVVGSVSGLTADPGLHRVSVRSLSYPGYKSFPGMVLWAGRGGQIPAPPGAYTVRLTA